jgi:putative oxidoreductase
MNIVKQIPFYLLAIVFVVFGAMYFLHMMPEPKDMTDNMKSFITLFGGTGYMNVIKALEIIGGLLLLLPKTRAMGMCIVAPICVNILLFELLIAKQPGIGIALVLLCVLAIYSIKQKFAGVILG